MCKQLGTKRKALQWEHVAGTSAVDAAVVHANELPCLGNNWNVLSAEPSPPFLQDALRGNSADDSNSHYHPRWVQFTVGNLPSGSMNGMRPVCCGALRVYSLSEYLYTQSLLTEICVG
jgi:hypothetical protein